MTRVARRRRGGLGLGLALSALALAAGTLAQVRWLRETADAAPVLYRDAAEARLRAVASEVEAEYRADATRILTGPADAVRPESDDDDVNTYFRGAPAEEATYYYLFALTADRRLKVTLYHPTRRHEDDPDERWYWGVARNASLKWIDALTRGAVVDVDSVQVYEANVEMTVVYKPVVDAQSRIVAVAGLIVDPTYLRNVRLPAELAAAVARNAGGPALADSDVSAVDAAGALVFGAPGSGDVAASAPLRFPFPDWQVVARPRGASFEEVARRQFAVGLAEIALVALLLATGFALLARASAREMRLLRAKADFVSTMTHEFQSPLTSIRLHAEMLRSGRAGDAPETRETGLFIEREATRLGELANNILDVAKMDAGGATYRFRELDLVAEVRAAVERVAFRAAQAGVTVEVAPPDAPLPPVVADREALGRAISNVLDNAVKWSDEGGRVEVRFGASDGLAWASVRDFGRGIPRADLGRVFERFYRVDTGLEHDVKGSGIGLAIVKHIVDAHRGRVTVESALGEGSTFALAFPASRPSEGDGGR